MTTYDKFNNPLNESGDRMNAHNSVPLQNVNYGYDQPAQNTTVIQMNRPEYVVEPSFSWCHFVMSLILMLVNPCAWVFSLLGVIYSANAYASHGDKAYEKSKRQNHIAMIFWIISIVMTLISVIIMGIVIGTVIAAADTAVNHLNDISNSINSGDNFNG